MKYHVKVTSSVAIIIIAIQLIADCIAYRLPGLFKEYLEFSGINGFVSTILKKTIISM